MEDYLKALYRLQHDAERVSTSAVAEAMGVSAASATSMVKRLASVHLVDYERYRGVTLTADGQRAALETIRHHRLIELYLQHALGYGWDEVDEEAERLEHAVSPAFAAKIEEALGFPTRDPHGHPIPSSDLEMDDDSGALRLADIEAPGAVKVRVVDDSNAELLRYVGELGLLPGTEVTIQAVAPFMGPLTLEVGGVQCVVGRELARHVLVSPATTPEEHVT